MQRTRRDPFEPPFEEGLYVGDINTEFRVLLNKFNVVRHHILIASRSFVQQETRLTASVFDAVLRCVRELHAFAFFNCGPLSGAR